MLASFSNFLVRYIRPLLYAGPRRTIVIVNGAVGIIANRRAKDVRTQFVSDGLMAIMFARAVPNDGPRGAFLVLVCFLSLVHQWSIWYEGLLRLRAKGGVPVDHVPRNEVRYPGTRRRGAHVRAGGACSVFRVPSVEGCSGCDGFDSLWEEVVLFFYLRVLRAELCSLPLRPYSAPWP